MKFYLFLLAAILLLNNAVISQQLFDIKGVVLDEHDRAPLPGVSILLTETKLGGITEINGSFLISNIPAGNYTLRFSYVGHSTVNRKIVIPSKEAEYLEVFLEETAIRLNDIIITGNPFSNGSNNIVKPLVSLNNLDLDIVRNYSIGEMLNYQTGVSVVSNGTAVSRPVIRGFGSNRVVILEDGLRMGDLSGSSSDHSISEDGSSPERIEIVRGASSLLYTSSSPGGVINIISELIPSKIPSKFTGQISLSGNSVSEQKFGNAEINYGLNRFSVNASAFYREGDSYTKPSGDKVANSDFRTKGFRGGISFNPDWGTVGFGINKINNTYGIPFNDADHEEYEHEGEGPVYIDMDKTELKGIIQLENPSMLFPAVTLKLGLQDYKHSEIARISGETGSRFALSTISSDLQLQHTFIPFSNVKSAFGFSLLKQDYSVTGDEALTPNAELTNFSVYLFEEIDFSLLNLQASARYEFNKTDIPESELSDSLFPSLNKNFNTLSSSISATIPLTGELSFFSAVSNYVRTPAVEELGSYAEHHALGSFDIGDRNLVPENNLGFEAGFRYARKNLSLEINGYYNSIKNYIFRNPTSMFWDEGIFNDTAGVQVFKYMQTDAEIYGTEFKGIADITDGLSVTVTADYIVGKYKNTTDYLPQIPPFRLSIEPKYIKHSYWIGMIWKGASEQKNTASNEIKTKGFGVIDIYGGFKIFTGKFIHQLDLKIENLMNLEYREHLSALKEFAPMPGRNFSVSYKMLF